MKVVCLCVILLYVSACLPHVPNGSRTICDGSRIGSNGWTGSECTEHEAEPCHPEHATYEQDVADGTCKTLEEARADRRNAKLITTGTILGLAFAVVLGAAVLENRRRAQEQK